MIRWALSHDHLFATTGRPGSLLKVFNINTNQVGSLQNRQKYMGSFNRATFVELLFVAARNCNQFYCLLNFSNLVVLTDLLIKQLIDFFIREFRKSM